MAGPHKGDNAALNAIAAATNIGYPSTRVEKSITFDGGTTNDIGDFNGTGNTGNLFTVTGRVALTILAVCTTSLVGASATVEVGTALSTAGLIAQTTGTNIDVNEIWHDATPDASVELRVVTPVL